jgi:phosphonate transport system permease protein
VSGLRDGFVADRAALPAADWRGRAITIAVVLVFGGLYLDGLLGLDVAPGRLWSGLWRLWDIVGLMLPPRVESWARLQDYLDSLGQTLAIALLGTLTGAVFAVPLGFLAARNIVTNRVLHFVTRRGMDTMRSVDTLIWALIWINVVGLGPFAGALAIASSDLCALGKLLSEAIETADRRPVEGILSTGGRRLEAIRFGVVPQILPVFASQLLYFFESNTRSATIIGIVGAGGIGMHLSEEIRVLEWQHTSLLILMVLITVAIIDQLSQRLRTAING